jgi:hypothetical protein
VAPITLTPITLGDTVRLRKPHACGSHEWTIVRLGADIGLRCSACKRRVLLSRREFEKRLAGIIQRTADAAQSEGPVST